MWTWYHSNGEKRYQVNYVQGKKHGKAIEWDNIGFKVQETAYKKGEIIEEK